MKTLLTGALMLLLSVPSFAQANASTTDGYQPFTLPANPSARQITKLLIETTKGIHDPFAVLKKIGSMGNAVVPALQTFLFNTPTIKVVAVSPDGKVDSVLAPKPHKVYAITALKLIGTPEAYQVIAAAAQSDSNNEVKGMALRALSTTYYQRAREDSLVPDKQVVGLLMQNLYDTTYVRQCGCEIARIARQGLKTWTGVDYGQVPPENIRKAEEQRLGMTLTQYREQWWQNNSANMSWDAKKALFELK